MLHGFLNYMLPLDIGDEAVKDFAMRLLQALHGRTNGKVYQCIARSRLTLLQP